MRKVHTLTLAFLVIGGLSLAGGLLVGTTDNPPGILVGLIGYFTAGFRARKSHAKAPSA